MKTTVKTTAFMAVAVLGMACATWAVPIVSNVSMEQTVGTRLVKINYTLTGEDAIITLSIETNGVAIPDSAVTWLSGDVCKKVEQGSRSIIWNAGMDWPQNLTTTAKACVTAWCIDAPPQYCAVDVVGGSAATNYPVYYYTSSNGVPRGVTNKLYKTNQILLRRLAPTDNIGFQMGESSGIKVTLSHGFYAGVFEVTQGQWYNVMGDWPSERNNEDYRMPRPVEKVSYEDIRGSNLGARWPGPDGDKVDIGSFMENLRTKSGQVGFDLPTEAQWEYACRAGTDSGFNDGKYSGLLDDRLNLLGRYSENGGKIDGQDPGRGCTTEYGTAVVGSYVPNAWGLYDMHGNVREWCLDWSADTLSGGADPKGPASNVDNKRMGRSGSWYDAASGCRSESRYTATPASQYRSFGFRLVKNIAR